MSGLTLWMNQEIKKLKQEMDMLYDGMIRDFCTEAGFMGGLGMVSRMDLIETDQNIILEVELPGVELEDVDLDITDQTLTLKIERSEKVQQEVGSIERTDSHTRSVRLPCKIRIEDVKASFRDDVLKVVMPKCPPESKRMKLTVK